MEQEGAGMTAIETIERELEHLRYLKQQNVEKMIIQKAIHDAEQLLLSALESRYRALLGDMKKEVRE
jgi:phage gp36-like protein